MLKLVFWDAPVDEAAQVVDVRQDGSHFVIYRFVHRPVVALIEVEVYRVQKDKRARIRDEVAASLGPPDPTVLVQEKEDGASVNIPQLLETFRKFGDVVLVRVTDDAVLVTFKKSTSAVSATAVKEVSYRFTQIYLAKHKKMLLDDF